MIGSRLRFEYISIITWSLDADDGDAKKNKRIQILLSLHSLRGAHYDLDHTQVLFQVRKKMLMQSLKQLAAIAVTDLHRFVLFSIICGLCCSSVLCFASCLLVILGTLQVAHCWAATCWGRSSPHDPGARTGRRLEQLLDQEVRSFTIESSWPACLRSARSQLYKCCATIHPGWHTLCYCEGEKRWARTFLIV